LNIRIFYDEVNFRLRGWRKAVKIFVMVIGKENKIPGDLNFIITDDISIKKINNEFLKHNYFTDVIAFSNSFENVISGEIYISIDAVKRNAQNYNVSLREEVIRVMIHGLLHLCGYTDNSIERKEYMRGLEDLWLSEYSIEINEV